MKAFIATLPALIFSQLTLAIPQSRVTVWPGDYSLSSTSDCPPGSTRDSRSFCLKNSTTSSQTSSTFTCPSGYKSDYRGAPYCRRTFLAATPTSLTSTSNCAGWYTTDYRGRPICSSTARSSTTPSLTPTSTPTLSTSTRAPFYPSPGSSCPPTYTSDYRGICRPLPIPTPEPVPAVVKKRIVTTETSELKCDTRRGTPKCPQEYKCKEIAKCPPFIAFCPGTCVDLKGTGT
ncbi:hypothetical protein B0J11DRAFT_599160 [Dendryphion nanum]|uniref:Uncharacterized protein n=1 Tax=Dendryphion nanum TaxID=256645 RepID=A0A9P9D1H1_9PLEO|nr:hypothetical protein B0J11DRAFT_599160 [Dendryphion nanum]